MTRKVVPGRSIQAGYEWRLGVTVAGVGSFDEGATFTAQVRPLGNLETLLVELSSDDGTIIRNGADELELVIPASASASWPARHVVLDVVRTDLPAAQHLGFRLTVPVVVPVTRGI